MKLVKSRLKYILAGLLAIFFCNTAYEVDNFSDKKAYAAESSAQVSNVIDDLSKDESFKMLDYPENRFDYSLQLIQVAESNSKELYIYVYQPCGAAKELTATAINMSLSQDVTGTELYSLTLLNSSNVFYKYRVNDLTVRNAGMRYYNITSIYRAWDSEIDKPTGNDNTINEVSFEVGQLWTASTVDGDVSYNKIVNETVLITDKYVDFIEYNNRMVIGYDQLDSHYVAFSTNYSIDVLYEAEIYFVSQDYRARYSVSAGAMVDIYTWDEVRHYELFKGTDKGENKGGLIYPHYEWERIQSVSDFKTSLNSQGIKLSENTETNLSNKQWVLRFYESESYWENGIEHWGTRVKDVTILRLKFKANGQVYNLGVVDNKQAGDDEPGNPPNTPGDEKEGFNFFTFLWNCIVKTFTGAGAWWEIAVTVGTILISLVVVGLIALVLRFVIWCFRGKRGKRGKKGS